MGREPLRIGLRRFAQLAPGVGEPDQGQRRQQDADGEQPWLEAVVPGTDAQPEMQSDTAVQPDHDQHHALSPGVIGPQPVEHVDVVVVDAEPLMGAAGAEDMDHEQERDQQTGNAPSVAASAAMCR